MSASPRRGGPGATAEAARARAASPSIRRRAAALALAFCGAAWADAAPSAAPAGAGSRYPIPVALELAGRAGGAVFYYTGVGNVAPPPDPGADVPVGAQARAAYAAATQRMFARGVPVATLEIEGVSAGLDFDDDGWHAVVDHVLVLRAEGGAEIARWGTTGRELIVGYGRKAMPSAFAGAAERAARAFEARFEEPAGVVGWLRAQGVEPRGPPPPLAAARPPEGAPPHIPRRGIVPYADAALGLFLYRSTGIESTSAATGAVALRAGACAPWAFAQIGVARTYPDGFSSVRSLGIEAGPVLSLQRGVELVAGLGVAWVRAGGSSRTVATAFGGARVARLVSPGGARIRLGLEAREDFGKLEAQGRLGPTTVLPAASLWLLAGLEWPVGRT